MRKKDPAKTIHLFIDESEDHILARLFSPSNQKPNRSSSILVNYLAFLICNLIFFNYKSKFKYFYLK